MKGEKNRWDPNGENLHPPPMCNARSALHRGISTEDTAYTQWRVYIHVTHVVFCSKLATAYTRNGSCAELVGVRVRFEPHTSHRGGGSSYRSTTRSLVALSSFFLHYRLDLTPVTKYVWIDEKGKTQMHKKENIVGVIVIPSLTPLLLLHRCNGTATRNGCPRYSTTTTVGWNKHLYRGSGYVVWGQKPVELLGWSRGGKGNTAPSTPSSFSVESSTILNDVEVECERLYDRWKRERKLKKIKKERGFAIKENERVRFMELLSNMRGLKTSKAFR
ncbi:hypothetical protein LXL04_018988 [Taraxacum kok-saghyz]